mmetsp:Transcript_12150/g.33672  ORF Transcript_12150/g.33672 Transcript_12150/m.33672 type:complete len:1000 (-) Transcript_12150:3555-6554(-)
MPKTDIRSFFAKAASKPKKKKGSDATGSSTSSTKNKSGLSGSRRKGSVAPAELSSSNDTKKQKRVIGDDDDDDDEKGSSPVAIKQSLVRKNKKRKSDESENRMEISASDFFGKGKSSVPSSPSKRKKISADSAQSSSSKGKSEEKKEEKKAETIMLDQSEDDDKVAEKDEDYKEPSDDTKDDNDSVEVVKVKSNPKKISQITSPRKKPPPTLSSPPKQKKPSPAAAKKKPSPEKKLPALKPKESLQEFDIDNATSQCLLGYTFVVTGTHPDHSREDVSDWIKILGGRVTTAVSSKTDYLLLMGDTLEDGRPTEEGSKYRKATESQSKVQIVDGKEKLYGLMHQYSRRKAGENGSTMPSPTKPKTANVAVAKPAPKPVITKNPYAKVTSNPYAKKATANPYAARKPVPSATAPEASTKSSKSSNAVGSLWVDRYKPMNSSEILGNQELVRKLKLWLGRWESRFNQSSAIGKSFSNPQGPWKCALLSGPPGIGKTTTATLVAQEAGREVVEYNASDVRSKKALKETLGDITGSRSIQFSAKEKRIQRCIIMDEVDGMGAGDRSGVSELIQMIKNSQVPIICICNDRQSQKLKSLVPYCMDLKYRRPTKHAIAKRAVEVASREGFSVEINAAEAITESCGNDVRQVLNNLQMWSTAENSNGRMTYKDVKERERSVNKDEIHRVGLFDAARVLLEGRRGLAGADDKANLASFFHRNDAFFVDYGFTGLLVQQNYLKVAQGQFNDAKRCGSSERMNDVLDGTYKAAESMSDYAHAENKLRSEQNWSVLPFVGSLVVKTGFHAGGENGGIVPGFPEFTTWLGRNSTKNKRTRLLSEMNHHMNYKISGGTTEMRLSYLPTLRSRFASLLTSGRTEEAIHLMDEYGLDRDDVLEKMDEFKMDPKDKGMGSLDSKKKAAFTKTYNAGFHKSQALVAEQGQTAKKSKRSASSAGETKDPDAIDDDEKNIKSDAEDEEDEDAAKIAALFKKKGRRAAAKKAPAKRGRKKK